MTSQQPPAPFIVSITNHLPLVEKVLLTALAIGTILTVMHVDSTVTRVLLFGLAAIFFLMAYRPIDFPREENERLGLPVLFRLTMVPKVFWICSAVSAVGIGLK